ncbi:hypothetical protein O6H91_01G080700 [Diphasiastrum complanatum]|uniref:Uncharacterized protein n=1 Tax=Diphasiastrum complanatum TaxID=34168 RepID=A0ACC2ESI1_DIPCM|nr:hypothetical protein O6H91_01G080700 [Diphasiastrum complanatum]
MEGSAFSAPICCYLIWLFFVCSSLVLLRSAATDADLLQDFCVAELQSSVRVNGFPCKNVADVQGQDFVFSGLAHAGNTSLSLTGVARTPASVLQFPGLNTQGISMVRADFAPGGLNVPHLHPRASELAFILEGTFYAGFITTSNKLYTQTAQGRSAYHT